MIKPARKITGTDAAKTKQNLDKNDLITCNLFFSRACGHSSNISAFQTYKLNTQPSISSLNTRLNMRLKCKAQLVTKEKETRQRKKNAAGFQILLFYCWFLDSYCECTGFSLLWLKIWIKHHFLVSNKQNYSNSTFTCRQTHSAAISPNSNRTSATAQGSNECLPTLTQNFEKTLWSPTTTASKVLRIW